MSITSKLVRSRTSLVALLCATALLAGACGGSSADSSAEVATEGTDGTETNESAPASGSDSPASTESPLGDLIGIPIGDDDAAEQYFNDLSRQAEVKIAECMIAQGHEYQVVDYSQVAGLGASVDFESREFAEDYGFGIASDPFEESFEAFEAFEDPNQQYVSELSEGEREAYEIALSGELPDFDSADIESFEPSGCQGQAFSEVFAFGEVFDEFGDEFEAIEEAYYADPRIVGATTGWSGCMTEAGYRFTDLDSAEADIQRRYDAIVRDPDAFQSEEEQLDNAEPDEDGTFFLGPQTLNPEFQVRVDELAVEERAIALASWECNGPLREIEDEVRIEYEQRFVDENGAAIRATLGEE